jgi:hypothetical protein
MSTRIPIVGTHSVKGKALLALVLPRVENGKIYLNPPQHRGLCEILDRAYPLAAGESHKGEFVFGMPVVVRGVF